MIFGITYQTSMKRFTVKEYLIVIAAIGFAVFAVACYYDMIVIFGKTI